MPVVDDQRSSRDFGTEGDGRVVPILLLEISAIHQSQPQDWVTYVPSDCESESIVDVAGAELRNRSRKREPCSHLTKTLHHGENSETSEGITKEDRKRTGLGEGTSNSQEETGSNGTTESDELDVSRLEAGEIVSCCGTQFRAHAITNALAIAIF